MNRTKIIHVIPSLDLGGAERILCTIASQVDPRHAEMRVITMVDSGPLKDVLINHGVQVETLGMHRGTPDPRALVRLVGLLRQHPTDLVVTWMCHANLLGGMAAFLAGNIPVVWNIRNTNLHPRYTKRMTEFTTRLGAPLSRWLPKQVVFVANSSRTQYVRRGYADSRSVVIPNGFNLTIHRPDPNARCDVRRELALTPDCSLVGLFCRFHPDKDHENFVRAAARIHSQRPDVKFLLCGSDVSHANDQLVGWIHRAGLAASCFLLGPRNDMPRLIASLDLLVSSSVSEALPGVVGETMASSVPCVVTDVGDSATLVGRTGRIVPPRDDVALANACLNLLSLPTAERQRLGALARERIAIHFSFDRMIAQHFQLWSKLAGRPVVRRSNPMQPTELQAA